MLAAGSPYATDARAQAGETLYNEADLLFLHHMIVHHRQALDMADLVSERTDREEFIRFARNIYRAQAAEIAHMQKLLDIAFARGLTAREHAMHGDPPMEGMLSSAQMAELEASTGAAFERLWLEGMIYHHQGAIDMARGQEHQQLESGRSPYGIDVLVQEMLVVQRAEIQQMQVWLTEWGSR